ncbi:hypothetical protein J6590_088030 [Homalodisca vitripennis]|nr:hypothetical protein J6590_088030 [Homalodisca vitripennis]
MPCQDISVYRVMVRRRLRLNHATRDKATPSHHCDAPMRESCRSAFRELGFLTLPCLYILEVILYSVSRCALVRGRDVHQHGTRGRDNLRVQQHRTNAFRNLPSQVGVRLINSLPEHIKQQNGKRFKTQLKTLLISRAFYSVCEFMMGRWDD